MSNPEIYIDYHGQVDLRVIELLLKKLKNSREFAGLNKPTAKRTYAIVVECLENIYRHSIILPSPVSDLQPGISVRKENDRILISAGNLVKNDAIDRLTRKLDKINSLDQAALKTLYESTINLESKKNENGAGLGFISMAIKSGNRIGYSFTPSSDGYSYFALQILLNKYIMRKLIIDQTSYSPKVILDPENKIFLISGESRPPDVREFYDQVLSWLDDFSLYLLKSAGHNDPVSFNFNFEYFNSSSGKVILDICKVLASLRSKGINICVNWHFEKDDIDMLEVGREISKIVKIPFEYVEVSKN
jgi:hypothetical protein